MDEPLSFIQDFGQGPTLGPACSRTGDTARSKADLALVALTLGAGDSPQTGECTGQCRLVTNSLKNLDRVVWGRSAISETQSQGLWEGTCAQRAGARREH